jgi:hypothetical protein
MFADTLLRLLVVVVCVLGISLLAKLALWTVEPWARRFLGGEARIPVAVEPVGFVEAGKVQTQPGASAARSLSHRLQENNLVLSRDLTEQYALVQKHLKVSLPEAGAPAEVAFDSVVSEPVAFEAKFFNVDVVGIGNFVYRQLYAGNSIHAMVEVLDDKVRYFVEVSRPEKPPGEQIQQLDRTVTGDVHRAFERLACDIAYLYHGEAARFSGLSAESFCEFLGALRLYHDFIVRTAAAAENGEPVALAQLERVIAAFDDRPLAELPAPVVHALRASLYKLKGDIDKAIGILEQAASLAPGDRFVLENLPKWQAERDAQPIPRPVEPPEGIDATKLEAAYGTVLSQPALAQVGYQDLLRKAASARPKRMVVAVLSTGYAGAAAPRDRAEILPVENLVDDETPEDGNGHGTDVANLLAALVPFEEVQILPVKVLSNNGTAPTERIVEGFARSIDRGARIIVAPLGGSSSGELWNRMVARAENANVLVMAAAGNSAQRPGRTGVVDYPAAVADVVAVGATDPEGNYAPFSPGPEGVDVFVPGIDIVTVAADGTVREFAGTSFSVTLAAGVVATAVAPRPEMRNDEIRAALRAGAPASASGEPPVLRAPDVWARLAAAPAGAP